MTLREKLGHIVHQNSRLLFGIYVNLNLSNIKLEPLLVVNVLFLQEKILSL